MATGYRRPAHGTMGPAANQGAMELDQLAIIDVEPVRLREGTRPSTWPCAACSSWHDIASGYAVRHHENGRERTTYVCGACARALLEDRSEL